eukprot:CAMPEP_0114516604 /NCGR_PEP_ID=MMETSP0109-20121206/17422_1 /TAXON_ID=29199 /ORGANISM="Chlorarachnion reptans, Strain CCCM449" /LENGTH=495 /DNA_ID=CAMNT_0001697015 /DNA_START=81 /DNA_END=1564 /DNA_ORIENTATION=-
MRRRKLASQKSIGTRRGHRKERTWSTYVSVLILLGSIAGVVRFAVNSYAGGSHPPPPSSSSSTSSSSPASKLRAFKPSPFIPAAVTGEFATASQHTGADGSTAIDPKLVEAKKKKAKTQLDDLRKYQVSYRLHAFYYPWYGTPEIDGAWQHWNHEIMPHWTPSTTNRFPKGRHTPPEDIGANFYPVLGPYSSLNETVVVQHMMWFRRAGIGVCVVSWYPPEASDQHQSAKIEHSDRVIPLLLDVAGRIGIKIAFHIEPYKDRSANSIVRDLKYIHDTYSSSPAFYRSEAHADRTVVYVYDSYHTHSREWSTILASNGPNSIRGKYYDSVMLALWVNGANPTSNSGIEEFVTRSRFDGIYTYFAGSRFAWGASPDHWNSLCSSVRTKGLLCSPSVGPGYIDTRVRPWNRENNIDRHEGEHYDSVFAKAVQACPDFISITSFNEWHEGTQIEPYICNVARRNKCIGCESHPEGWGRLDPYLGCNSMDTHAYLDATGA